VKHKSLNETAYEMIRDKILKGEFEPGSRLREDLLAEEISMSRTPVREAINRLVSDGLVINHARKGLYLIKLEDGEIEDYIDIRSSLERLSVEKCIRNATSEQKETIRTNLQKFKSALERQDFETCNTLDGDFHMSIARIANNQKLLDLLKDLSAFFQLARRTEKRTHPLEKNERTFREHSKIVEAILAGDTEAARMAMAANIETMRTNLHQNAQRNEQ
jgi:DNA-binding GntR family transcriptional regulator